MKNFPNSLLKPPQSAWAIIFIFVLIAILTYGVLIPYLGFFWDDYPLAWIEHTYGGEGLARYFSTNRPYLVPIYKITTSILGDTPWHWQVFSLFWRTASAISFWLFLRHLWPRRFGLAFFAGIAFLVYPGFMQQWISIIYGHFFVILTAFMLSLVFTIKAIRSRYSHEKSSKSVFYTILALSLSFVNLICLEYFFTLELIRFVVIWMVASEYIQGISGRLRKTIVIGIPYLLLFIGVTAWRVFYFPYQTNNYQLSIMQRLSYEPLQAILSLIQNVIDSIWTSSVSAWINIFHIPDINDVGRLTIFGSFGLVVITFLLVLIWLFLVSKRSNVSMNIDEVTADNPIQPILFGISALLLAGWPVWLIDRSPSLSFSMDRFTLPFMMGSALVIVGLFELLPLKFTWKAFIYICLISLCVGFHFRVGNSYRRDWETQRRFFWQLIWRIPALKEGTTLLTNQLPVTHYSDNSLTAPLNWIYAPQNHTEDMTYLMLYPEQRLGGTSLPVLEENVTINVDYLAAAFEGSTSQIVSIYYEPPACLRVLDNKLDALNHMLPLLMQHTAELSDQGNILAGSMAVPPDLLFPEEEHGWCFYYEQAELARQQADWEAVVSLGESAFALGDYPNDPAERLPFIEGYARTGDWNRAIQQTNEVLLVSSKMIPVLCLLWERVDQDSAPSTQKIEAINLVSTILECTE